MIVNRTGYTTTLTTTKSEIVIVTGDTAAEIEAAAKRLVVKQRALRMKCTTADGAVTYTPTLTRDPAATDADSVKHLYRPSGTTPIADVHRATFSEAYEGAPDSLGKLYLAAFPNDAGAIFEYELVLEVFEATTTP